ncbi:MAG: 1-(5-phosphoribosyl)-5-[(5-phosphoribosylamino)methylideneamino]imidazole-4-carboxamide isomerase [Oscillospiraceae bacterium]|nr:1-(5-phosphoribosyl)-5-[(5-phosphoribosylamino)methylideneamino]imidazole-4-carboxamide isomerase [Oscillospiraceae bacterium]
MNIFPAIDIKDGKAVRLLQGDYDQVTVFNQDPAFVASDFKKQGAEFLHIVDLDGARDGKFKNFKTIERIIATGIKCQVGGGIRDLESCECYLSIGAQRVILGSAALNDEFLQTALDRFGEKIAVGVDARKGKVAIKGWRETSELDSVEFCKTLSTKGIKTIIYTDISRDGMMRGTNLEIYRLLQSEINAEIIASGGISSMEELSALSDMGIYGAILGKAIYIGAINLAEVNLKFGGKV